MITAAPELSGISVSPDEAGDVITLSHEQLIARCRALEAENWRLRTLHERDLLRRAWEEELDKVPTKHLNPEDKLVYRDLWGPSERMRQDEETEMQAILLGSEHGRAALVGLSPQGYSRVLRNLEKVGVIELGKDRYPSGNSKLTWRPTERFWTSGEARNPRPRGYNHHPPRMCRDCGGEIITKERHVAEVCKDCGQVHNREVFALTRGQNEEVGKLDVLAAQEIPPAYLDEMPLVPAAVPGVLIERQQWVNWQRKLAPEGKWHKLPLDPASGKAAKTNGRTTWGSFQSALDGLGRPQTVGIGFVFTDEDPYCGVDLDDCRDAQSEKIAAWAQTIIDALDSYTEVSPTGTGVKIFVKAQLPGPAKRRDHIEVYDRQHYFTVTGQHLTGSPTTIEPRQEAITALHARCSTSSPQATSVVARNTTQADGAILSRAHRAKSGEKFGRLWAGDTTGYPSASEADMALAGILAFYTRDPEQIERVMRQSGLHREKWDTHATYLMNTISKALAPRATSRYVQTASQPR